MSFGFNFNIKRIVEPFSKAECQLMGKAGKIEIECIVVVGIKTCMGYCEGIDALKNVANNYASVATNGGVINMICIAVVIDKFNNSTC